MAAVLGNPDISELEILICIENHHLESQVATNGF